MEKIMNLKASKGCLFLYLKLSQLINTVFIIYFKNFKQTEKNTLLICGCMLKYLQFTCVLGSFRAGKQEKYFVKNIYEERVDE